MVLGMWLVSILGGNIKRVTPKMMERFCLLFKELVPRVNSDCENSAHWMAMNDALVFMDIALNTKKSPRDLVKHTDFKAVFPEPLI